jgi:hypothetical protein
VYRIPIVTLLVLLQSKASLPPEADYMKALEKLKDTPADPDANTTAGKYVAFVQGDYDSGMKYLSKSSDVALKTLADHELAPLYTANALQKMGMGDEWVAAAKNHPTLTRIFYDRAAHWHTAGWPDLDDVGKLKYRAQGRRLAAARPPGQPRKLPVTGWVMDVGNAGRPPVIDGSIARVGSYSAKLVPADEKVQGSVSAIRSALTPVSGKVLDVTAYVFSDGTENAQDRILVRFYNQNNSIIASPGAFYPVDTPFWNPVTFKADIPKDAVRVEFLGTMYSKNGSAWIDDVSMKVDGKEIIKNGSFEEK